ncbi:hypothetical protein Bpfe_000524, partial [Biomphalaria pfeifferi]
KRTSTPPENSSVDTDTLICFVEFEKSNTMLTSLKSRCFVTEISPQKKITKSTANQVNSSPSQQLTKSTAYQVNR